MTQPEHDRAVLAANAEYRAALLALDDATRIHDEAVARCEHALARIRYLARKDVTS